MNFTFSFLPILGSINLEVSPVGEIIFIDALLGFLIHALIDKVLISLGIFSSNSLISPTLIKLADTCELDAPSFPTPATITIPLIFPTEVIYLDILFLLIFQIHCILAYIQLHFLVTFFYNLKIQKALLQHNHNQVLFLLLLRHIL